MRRREEPRSFRAVGAALVVAAVLAPPAAAQVALPGVPNVTAPPGSSQPAAPAPDPQTPPAGPQPQPSKPPAEQVPPSPSAGGDESAADVVSLGLNPGGTHAAGEESVAGPLEPRWSKDFKAEVTQPLISAGIVVAAVRESRTRTRVVALSARTGKTLWSRQLPRAGRGMPIALNRGRVIVTGERGEVTALGLADGAVKWTVALAAESPRTDGPVLAAGGRVFVWLAQTESAGSGAIAALSVEDGSQLWRRSIGVNPDIAPFALDGERVFVGDECGGVRALSQATGAPLWQVSGRPGNRSSCSSPLPVLAAGGKVYAYGQGDTTQVIDAATGALATSGATMPGAAASDGTISSSFFNHEEAVTAFTLAGKRRWSFPTPGFDADYRVGDPVIVGPTVYASGSPRKVYALDRGTGKLMWRMTIPGRERPVDGNFTGGFAPSAGVLAVAAWTRLTAFAPMFSVSRRSAELLASPYVVWSGQTVCLFPAVGRDLRGRRFVVERDPYPYGRYSPAGAYALYADGTGSRLTSVTRNTRVRVRIAGTKIASKPVTLYAYPRMKVKTPLVNRTTRQAVTTLSGDPGFKLFGRRAYAYLGRDGRKRWERLGSGVLRKAGKGRAVFRAPYKVPRPWGRKDGIWVCFPGDRTYGRPDNLSRRCGAAVIQY